ncbi:hypothetical protein FWK35_00027273 [Aphis craccivora]|uniref:Uncharacterized protein n=1 Tax=Aphis craccivora TaxID=307492 RepID=A0A6G0WP24_APHCR|nr:hypothetical protein FWK35_00027273 [Aphis craccivora]
MSAGIGSSHDTPDVHSRCIRYFVQNVIGNIKPRGSKTLAISESTVRFIGLSFEGCTLNEKVSANGSYFKPRTFRFACSVRLG